MVILVLSNRESTGFGCNLMVLSFYLLSPEGVSFLNPGSAWGVQEMIRNTSPEGLNLALIRTNISHRI